MSAWLTIEQAPKDRAVDLWGAHHPPERSERLMMPHAVYLRRWADCRWSPMAVTKTGLLMPMPEGWYFPMGLAALEEDNWRRIWPTHFMEIPEGPTR